MRPLKEEWDLSMESCKQVINAVSQFAIASTTDFSQMTAIRFKIKAKLHGCTKEMISYQKVLDEIQQAQQLQARAKNDQDANKNFTTQKVITNKTQVPTPYYSTICQICDHVCHENCQLGEIATKGSNAFTGCAAFHGKPQCHSCPNKCDYTTHYHGRFKITTVQTSVDEVLADIKATHDKAGQDLLKGQQNLTQAQQAELLIKAAMDKCVQEVEDACKQLKQICSGFNLASELYLVIKGLELEKNALRTTAAQNQADQMIKAITQIINRLNVMPVTNTNNNKGENFHYYSPYGDDGIDFDDDDDNVQPAIKTSNTTTNKEDVKVDIRKQQQGLISSYLGSNEYDATTPGALGEGPGDTTSQCCRCCRCVSQK